MPYYINVHRGVDGVTSDALAAAHTKDLEVQGKHGVHYLRYWCDENTGTVFCLSEAPHMNAAVAVHREAHGLEAQEIFEVKERH